MNERETMILLPVVLDLFDGDGSGQGVGQAPGSGPTAGSGPTTGSGPTAGGSFNGQTPGSGPTAGSGPGPGPVPGPAALPDLTTAPTPPAAMRARQLQAWSDQAEQAKALYPGFDLTREARNPSFRSMLRAGVNVRQAFEVLHMDEIKAAAAAAQARATERALTAHIKAKGARPQENGAGASSGFTVKDDVSRLTPKDRAEMARRAARGETITF